MKGFKYMRELVIEDQEVLIIPQNYRFINKGKVKSVSAGEFTLELDYEPDGIMKNNYCEFYTQTSHGKLYFDSYAKEIEGKNLVIASPAKHKFLQRRQYTRIKYVNNFDLYLNDEKFAVTTIDLSAGGMKFQSDKKFDIDGEYSLKLPLLDDLIIDCKFKPIRIEKTEICPYLVSGQFLFNSAKDRMMVVQYCAKRSVEIQNK